MLKPEKKSALYFLEKNKSLGNKQICLFQMKYDTKEHPIVFNLISLRKF